MEEGLGTPEGKVAGMAKEAQLMADLYYIYDLDSNGRIKPAEISSKESVDENASSTFFKNREVSPDGAGYGDLADMLADPSSLKKFFQLVPSFSAMWREDHGSFKVGKKSERQLITALVPEIEKMPEDEAVKVIAALKDFQIDLDVFAKRNLAKGTINELEHSSYMRAMMLYLRQKAHDLSPADFLKLVKEMQDKGKELKSLKALTGKIIPTETIFTSLKKMREESPPKGKKFILVYDTESLKFKLFVEPMKFVCPKGSKYKVLAVSSKKGNIKTFEKNFETACPWLAPFGRLRMLEGLKEARAKMAKLGIKSRVLGSGDMPLQDSISDEFVLSFIYAENGWSTIQSASSDEKAKELMDRIDMQVALYDSSAYCTTKSDAGAQGIAQMMKITHDDIKMFYPKAKLKGFKDTTCHLDKSLMAIFLIIDRKRETIAVKMQSKGADAGASFRYFFRGPHSFPSVPESAIAIAYNNSSALAADYAITGSMEGIHPNTRTYALAIQRTLRLLSEQKASDAFFRKRPTLM